MKLGCTEDMPLLCLMWLVRPVCIRTWPGRSAMFEYF